MADLHDFLLASLEVAFGTEVVEDGRDKLVHRERSVGLTREGLEVAQLTLMLHEQYAYHFAFGRVGGQLALDDFCGEEA